MKLETSPSGYTGPIASVSFDPIASLPTLRTSYIYQGCPIHMDWKIKNVNKGPWKVAAISAQFYDHLNQYVFQRELPSAAQKHFFLSRLIFNQLFHEQDNVTFAKSIMGSGTFRSNVTWRTQFGTHSNLLSALNKGIPLTNKMVIYYETLDDLDIEPYLKKTSWRYYNHLKGIQFQRGLSPQASQFQLKPGGIVFSNGSNNFFTNMDNINEKYPLANLVLRLVLFFGGAIALPYTSLGMKVIGMDSDKKGVVFITVFGNDGRFLDRFSWASPQAGELRDQETFKKIFKELTRRGWITKDEEFVLHFDGKLTSPLRDVLPWFMDSFPNASLVEILKHEQPLMARLRDNQFESHAIEGDFVILDEDTGVVCLNAQNSNNQCPRGLFARKVFGKQTIITIMEQIFNLAYADPFSLFNTPSLPISIRFAADNGDLAKDAIRLHDNFWEEVYGPKLNIEHTSTDELYF